MKSKENSNIKAKAKEEKLLRKYAYKKDKKTRKYITKGILNQKVKNSQSFLNTDFVKDNGIISLKSNEFAKVLSVEAIDLSLTSNNQKNNFFLQLKYLFQIKNLDLRIYKLDDKIDLNANKDYYIKLMEKFANDNEKIKFLKEQYSKLENLENENLTTTSRYYFVIISDNEKILEHQMEEIEMYCYNMNPRLNVKPIENKFELYQFLINLYISNANLEQLLWYDLTELITPLFIAENSNFLKFDDKF